MLSVLPSAAPPPLNEGTRVMVTAAVPRTTSGLNKLSNSRTVGSIVTEPPPESIAPILGVPVPATNPQLGRASPVITACVPFTNTAGLENPGPCCNGPPTTEHWLKVNVPNVLLIPS